MLAVGALVAGGANKIVLQPLLWRVDPLALGFALGLVALVLLPVVPLLGYFALTRSLRHGPASLQVCTARRAFAVPPSPLHSGMFAIALMSMAGNMTPTERVQYTDRVRLATVPGTVPIVGASMVLMIAIAVLFLWLPRPSVTLTPSGVATRSILRRHDIPWPELLHGGPLVPDRHDPTMPLVYHRTDGSPQTLRVVLRQLHVDRVFLATVIRHYIEHPDHRSDIGTQAELERLETGFAAWRPPAGPDNRASVVQAGSRSAYFG